MIAALDPPVTQTTQQTAAVHARDLTKSIDERPILRGVDLEIAVGESVAILGANGAGKSTLLKILATLRPPTGGEVLLFGQSLRNAGASLRAKIGLIAHQSLLYRELSARENLVFFGKLHGVADPDVRRLTLLNLVGLGDRANDPVKTFSRGMTQRAAIARALVHRPELLLADEPFAGLDVQSVSAVELVLEQLHAAGRTVLLVDHDIERSLRTCQRVIVLRGGRVVVDQPTNMITAAEVETEVNES